MSRSTTLLTIDNTALQASSVLIASRLTPIFSRGAGSSNTEASLTLAALKTLRDPCQRPVLVYNDLYDPFKPQQVNLPLDYSPYVNG